MDDVARRTRADRVRDLLDQHGTTYAEQAGINLSDKPSPLYRLFVLSTLLSARISADIAVAAAKALSANGMRTSTAMDEATWQQRVDALGGGGYRRYDERTATMLGDGARLLLDRWKGDLRRLHDEARDVDHLRELLQEFPGIGPAGADIFCREVQGVWTDVAPFVDDRVRSGAEAVGLPSTPRALSSLVEQRDLPRLAAALVRVTLDDDAAARVRDGG